MAKEYIEREALPKEVSADGMSDMAVAFAAGYNTCLEEVKAIPAADAIEELSKYANAIRKLKCEGWYLQQTKYHDGYQAVSTMPLPEPPKEGA